MTQFPTQQVGIPAVPVIVTNVVDTAQVKSSTDFVNGDSPLANRITTPEATPRRATQPNGHAILSNTITPVRAHSWNHIEPRDGKSGWIVSLGTLAILATMLLGTWLGERLRTGALETPAAVEEHPLATSQSE